MNESLLVKVELTAEDDSKVNTTVFQLLQWKFALKLELQGMKLSRGRQVSTHLRKILKLKRSFTKEQILQYVEAVLEEMKA